MRRVNRRGRFAEKGDSVMWKVSDDIRKGMKNAAETIMAAESVYISLIS